MKRGEASTRSCRVGGSTACFHRSFFLVHVSKIRFVSGHDFSRAEKSSKSKGFQPLRDHNRDPAAIFETRSSFGALL